GQGDPLHHGKQDETGHPVQLARLLVAPHEQYREHVEQQHQHHELGTYGVAHAYQPAEGNIVHDGGNAFESFVGIRHVVDQQQHAGRNLQGEDEQQNAPHRIPDVNIARQEITGQLLLHYFANSNPDIYPVNNLFYEWHADSLFHLVLDTLDHPTRW